MVAPAAEREPRCRRFAMDEPRPRKRYTLRDVWRYLKQRTGKQLDDKIVYDSARAAGIEPRPGSGPTLTADDVEKVLMSYYEREALRAERGASKVPRVRKVIAPKSTAAPVGPPAVAARPGPRLPRK